jgi:hypothetical protein
MLQRAALSWNCRSGKGCGRPMHPLGDRNVYATRPRNAGLLTCARMLLSKPQVS